MSVKQINVVLLVAAVICCFVLLFGFLQTSEAAADGDARDVSTVENETKSAQDATPAPSLSQAGLATSESSGSTSFREAANCAKYLRLADFFAKASKDPASALNSPEVAASLSVEQRRSLEENLEFVEENGADCERTSANDPKAGGGLYMLAEKAARAGDMNAAACFVLAKWPVSDSSEQSMQQLANQYGRTAREFVNSGVSAGNWKVVNAGVAAARVQHGILGAIGFSPEEKYYLYRLSQLGAPNTSWEGAMGYEAADLARSLNNADRERAESKAVSDFSRYFEKRRMNEGDLSSCDV